MDEVEYCIVRKNNKLAADEIKKLPRGTISTEQVCLACMAVYTVYNAHTCTCIHVYIVYTCTYMHVHVYVTVTYEFNVYMYMYCTCTCIYIVL